VRKGSLSSFLLKSFYSQISLQILCGSLVFLFSEKTSTWNTKRILVILFVIGLVIDFLLSPLGFETRESELRSWVSAVYFVIVGFVIPIAGLVSLFRRPRLAGVLAIVDAALLFFTAPADQAKFFFKVAPPPAVTIGEFILILVGIGYMLCGQRIYLENTTK